MERILVLSGMPGAGTSSLIRGLQQHFRERLNVIETYTTRLRPDPGPDERYLSRQRFDQLTLLWRVEHDNGSLSGVSQGALDQALSGRQGRLSVMVAPPLAFRTIDNYVRSHVDRSGDTDDGWIPCMILAPKEVLRRRIAKREGHRAGVYTAERILLLHEQHEFLAEREATVCGRQLRQISNGTVSMSSALDRLISLTGARAA